MKHTANQQHTLTLSLPVQARDSHFDSFGVHHVTIVDSRGVALFTMPKEYALVFVAAVNSHAALVAALGRMIDTSHLRGVHPDKRAALNQALAALDQAKA